MNVTAQRPAPALPIAKPRTAPRRSLRQSARLVPADLRRGGARRGLPVTAPALLRALVPDARADLAGRRATLAGEPADVQLPGPRLPGLQGVHQRRDARAGARQEGPHREPIRRPIQRERWSDHLAGIVEDAAARTDFAPTFDNYISVWTLLNYPRLLFNTAAIAVIGLIGTVVSCTLVAYGFARFRFPGRGALFLILISTIFLPAAVTLIPTYTIFVKLGWVGTWLPLLVPTFFANAYDVFLLRQYLLTIPREMDEAAAIDGAGPLRTLISVIVPQAWPVIIAVAIFHLVYSWNDFFGPLIYLSTKPDLQTLAVGLAQFSANRSPRSRGSSRPARC